MPPRTLGGPRLAKKVRRGLGMCRKPAGEHIKDRASAVGKHVTDDGVRALKARQAGRRQGGQKAFIAVGEPGHLGRRGRRVSLARPSCCRKSAVSELHRPPASRTEGARGPARSKGLRKAPDRRTMVAKRVERAIASAAAGEAGTGAATEARGTAQGSRRSSGQLGTLAGEDSAAVRPSLRKRAAAEK